MAPTWSAERRVDLSHVSAIFSSVNKGKLPSGFQLPPLPSNLYHLTAMSDTEHQEQQEEEKPAPKEKTVIGKLAYFSKNIHLKFDFLSADPFLASHVVSGTSWSGRHFSLYENFWGSHHSPSQNNRSSVEYAYSPQTMF